MGVGGQLGRHLAQHNTWAAFGIGLPAKLCVTWLCLVPVNT